MKAFSRAVDQIHDYEQRHLYQRAVLIEQLGGTNPPTMQKWLTVLTQDLLQVSRLAESMRYRLSASVPYDRIVQSNLVALQERPYPPLRQISEYVSWKITGVTDGYQQLLRRIDAMEKDFEATVAVLRTHIELRLQEQNIQLQDQNMKLLASVDSTTRGQAILQRTVESLSVIVITYYLTGLGSYVLKACYEMGWVKNANVATAIFVPIAFAVSFTLMTVGRKIIIKRMANPAGDPGGQQVGLQHAVRATREVDGRGGAGLVHRDDGVAVAGHADAVPERAVQRLAEHDAGVLDRVVSAGLQVAGDLDVQVQARVAGDEVEHVVEEPHARRAGAGPVPVQGQAQTDVRLLRGAVDGGLARAHVDS